MYSNRVSRFENQGQHLGQSPDLRHEADEVGNEVSRAEDGATRAEEVVPIAEDDVLNPNDRLVEHEDDLPNTVYVSQRFEEEYEPIAFRDDPEDEELDAGEGTPVRHVDIHAVQEKVAPLRDFITSNGEFVAYHGYRLPANYKVSHIERLLAEAGCFPKDTHLTGEELQSEAVAAWLREFSIFLPKSPFVAPTGRAPSLLGSKTVQIPTRIGYSSPSVATFVEHHLRLLVPSHPLYPTPGDSMCELCHEPYSKSHPPVLIADAGGCRGHIYGYKCLRNHLSSNTSVSHKCPKCRTRWFRPRRHEMREVLRAWTEVEQKEEEVVRREEEAFGEHHLGIRARRVLEDAGMIAWDAAGAMASQGKRWVLSKIW